MNKAAAGAPSMPRQSSEQMVTSRSRWALRRGSDRKSVYSSPLRLASIAARTRADEANETGRPAVSAPPGGGESAQSSNMRWAAILANWVRRSLIQQHDTGGDQVEHSCKTLKRDTACLHGKH